METKQKVGGRKNALLDLPPVMPYHGELPADLASGVHVFLLQPAVKRLKKTYKTNLDYDGFFKSKDVEKILENSDDKEVYKFAKLVHTVFEANKESYKTFMKTFDKQIWQPYCTQDFMNVLCRDFAPTRAKYWDIFTDEPRKLGDIATADKATAAPAALVHVVNKVFNELSEIVAKNCQKSFSKQHTELHLPKFSNAKEFVLYVIDEGKPDCYNAFSAFCKAKGEADDHKYVAVVQLSKTLNKEGSYDDFIRLYHTAYQFIITKKIVSGELLAKMKTCDETYWNPATSNPNPLPKAVKA